MREIKFRAWHKKGNVMSDVGSMIGLDVEDIKHRFKYVAARHPVGEDSYTWQWNNIVLMQYTGLKDKNGREIYEGDIVKDHDGKHIYKVVYNMWGFELQTPQGHRVGQLPTAWLEIIGNIYENPELLK